MLPIQFRSSVEALGSSLKRMPTKLLTRNLSCPWSNIRSSVYRIKKDYLKIAHICLRIIALFDCVRTLFELKNVTKITNMWTWAILGFKSWALPFRDMTSAHIISICDLDMIEFFMSIRYSIVRNKRLELWTNRIHHRQEFCRVSEEFLFMMNLLSFSDHSNGLL